MRCIGIVGNEAAKFTPETEAKARAYIHWMLTQPGVTDFTSGGCHLGGIDIWAEEEARRLGLTCHIYLPKQLAWTYYRDRNLRIARKCDHLYNISLARYPQHFPQWKRFDSCYHCPADKQNHVKSGGCWTLKQALKFGKTGELVIIK